MGLKGSYFLLLVQSLNDRQEIRHGVLSLLAVAIGEPLPIQSGNLLKEVRLGNRRWLPGRSDKACQFLRTFHSWWHQVLFG